jgi:hypothetical protein
VIKFVDLGERFTTSKRALMGRFNLVGDTGVLKTETK